MSHASSTECAPEDVAAEPYPTTAWWKSSRWHVLAALVIAVIAAAVAILAWFYPHRSASHFSDEQTAAAKKNVCSADAAIHHAVVANTHLANPDPNSPIGQLAVAANARLALLGGGVYLRDRLAAEPAAPADLAKAVTAMANTIERLGINYLAGASTTVQDPLRHELDSQIGQINGQCA
jgi:hypothetical protein